MASYSIVVQEVQTVVDDMSSATKQLESSLENLKNFINAFTLANNGNAPDAYATAQADWNSGQDEMKTELGIGQARLADIIAGYVNGDQKGAGLF